MKYALYTYVPRRRVCRTSFEQQDINRMIIGFKDGRNVYTRWAARQFAKTLKGVVTNPIILGIVFGCIASLLPFSMPHIVSKALSDIGKTATPLGLMAMGAQVEFKSVRSRAGSAVLASVMKLMVFAVLFLPAAVALGFRREKLIAVMVMLGSATTVAGYIMAKNMGHEGTLTQTAVMLTTLLSSFTMTFWIYLMRTLGYL